MTYAATAEPKGVTMSRTTAESAVRELDHRSTDGLEVTLQWYAAEDVASVAVVDTKTGETFELVLDDGDEALDVFHHPYAYAARRGLLGRKAATEPGVPVAA
jgi:hypothetical protein